ncbi:contactin [Trichonephila inaurata madagascariensis]|uniref:Contactin n=1 Tax=Trichonephila inaurata madagascariensis TaxID=2747483 RepID=A0A8X6MD76_9ARAC|nr:contactin [Trichonephila inaurata madagascariensis]
MPSIFTTMCQLWVFVVFILCSFIYVDAQTCPKNWVDFKESCYKFTRTPLKTHDEAEERCRTYNADLVAANTLEEHYFIIGWLRENDPQHRRWYTSGRDDGDNVWVWDSDNSLFTDTDALFLPMQNTSYLRFAAYNYSDLAYKWGLQKVDPTELMAYICEISKEKLNQLIITERDIDYGIQVLDKEKIPRGPYFTQEPQPVIFDPSSRKLVNDVALKCVASGYPPPIYKWYREEFKNDELVSHLVDPLSDPRYTQTDGTLIISNPQQNQDRGNYHCTAENKYGVIVSQTASLSFGYIGEFNKKRSPDHGRENWGKSISCDPPQHYPRVNYYWVRNIFPNFVEEDQRVFVSHDGNLYFSSLEKVDAARYSCTVQSIISSSGRTGPFFEFTVEAASSGQKLLFPNNFPKAFPDAPLAGDDVRLESGDDVRLECVAYGYPVPSYNWTRKGFTSELPQGAYTQSYNRILILPKVRVEDIGDYFCTASNALESTTKSVPLRIQAKPEFTIPLEHKIVDKGSDLLWTCEAFGKPDVTYTWLRNGKVLRLEFLDSNDANRYRIYENILSIDNVMDRDEGMYQCKASNHLGSSYSSGQLRVITMKPSFAKYPMNSELFAAEGGNITIPCRPEAAPFPEFTWKRNNYGLSSTGRIRILTNGYLHINPVKREDEGRYSCIAKNQYGSDYTEGLLIVLSLPRMVDSPNPRVKAVVNDSAELPCQAYVGSDMLDLAYIWLQNGLRIDMEKQPQFSVGKLPGYLRIENITLAEAGVYHCIVKTAVGRISRPTQLVVFGPPGAPGAVLAEDLTATSGTIHWSDGSANGDPIEAYTIEGRTNHNSTWVVLKESKFLKLPFACAILLRRAVCLTLKMNSDSENECLIEERSSDEEFSSSESESDDDCLDSARDWCQIDVTSPLPSHLKFPFTGNSGIKVCIRDSGDPLEYFNLFLDDEMFSFIVEETNRYAESFFENTELTPSSRALKWKNTNKEEMKRFISLLLLQGVVQKPVEKWFWSKRPILSTPSFGKVISEVRYGLLMKFLHFANNDAPMDESLIAYKGRLSWKQYIPQKRARFGIKLFQLCESESGYIWNSLIYTGKGTAFNENYNDYGLLTKSVLTLIHELKGKGYCLSTDNFYTSPELAELLIDSKTDICGTLRPNRKGLPVSLQSSTVKKGEIIAFQKDVEKYRNRPESGRREVQLFNVLSPWSIYSFRVSAINSLGKGEPSQPSPLYNTEKDVPHVAPSNVGGGGGKTGSLTITWDPLPPQEWNAPEIWYNVSYKPANSDVKFQEISLKSRHNIGLHVVNVGEENYYKPYLVKAQAINSLGPGPYSDEVKIYSAENMPQVTPSQVYALAYNSTALNVTWAPLELLREKIRGKLIGYRIKYWQNGKDAEADSLILLKRGLENWGLIVGLQPNTEYYVAVMAYNDAGSGVESEPFLARTFKAAPLRPPTNVRVEAISPTSVSVSWRGVLPSTEEEPIKGYKVRYWESDQDMTSAKEVERYLDGNDLEVVVSGLTFGKVYKLRVLAFSNGGDGKMSSPVREFKIGEETALYRRASTAASFHYSSGPLSLGMILFYFLFKTYLFLV